MRYIFLFLLIFLNHLFYHLSQEHIRNHSFRNQQHHF
jgi:hypothetical protein